MPRARSWCAGFPTVRLVAALLVVVIAVPAAATLPPPQVRLATMFGRPMWQPNPIDSPAPPWVGVFRGVVNGR
ncbi:MAG TPA: hypothetical protein VJP05_00045 [Acidimicrobiia bacterium]|nr:hypothetical protein [Acidimicrobiia bacterium]